MSSPAAAQPGVEEAGRLGSDEPLDPNPRHIAVIINPISCPAGADRARDTIAAALARHRLQADYFETCETESALPIAARAIESGARLILAVGGDGTVMEAINATVGKGIPVGIIPGGTGNVLAANLGISSDFDTAVQIAVTGKPREIDLVKVNGGEHYFAIMGGMGYDAEIMRGTPRAVKQKVGKLAYLWTGIKDLQGARYRVDVRVDGRPAARSQARGILIGNMGEIMKGVRIFPSSDPSDGVVEVGVLKSNSWSGLFVTAWYAMRGRPNQSRYFDLSAGRTIEVRAARPVPTEIDGEYIGELTELLAEVQPRAGLIMTAAE